MPWGTLTIFVMLFTFVSEFLDSVLFDVMLADKVINNFAATKVKVILWKLRIIFVIQFNNPTLRVIAVGC